MPLIRTKALCERGHWLDGRHGPIMQTGLYLPTPPHGGTWHSSFPPYPLPNPVPNIPRPQRLAKTFYHRKNKKLPFIPSSLNQKEIIIITLTAEPQKQKEHSPNSKPENWWGQHRGESTADRDVYLATLGIP